MIYCKNQQFQFRFRWDVCSGFAWRWSFSQLCLGFCVFGVVAEPAGATGEAEVARELGAQREQLESQFANEVRELASWCQSNGLKEQAEETSLWVQPRDPLLWYVPRLPTELAQEELPKSTDANIVQWHQRFWELRGAQGDALLKLARTYHQAGLYSDAHRLLLEAARQDPDNEEIRNLLGFRRFRGQWLTPWQVRQVGTGKIWDDRFGWIRSSYLPRYEKGFRYAGTVDYGVRKIRIGWTNAEQEAKIRADIDRGWMVRTEHYEVTTNHSQAEGVKLAKRLEELHWVWRQLFWQFWTTEAEKRALLNPPKLRSRDGRLHQVICYKTREEYNEALRQETPGDITISNGVYFAGTSKAYFFAGPERLDTTVVHEGTHQLFAETNERVWRVVRRRNYWANHRANIWIVEGIACYMETLREENGFYVVGGLDNDRFKTAAYRYLAMDFYIPLEKFTGYGMLQMLRDPDIRALYGQSAALTTFLIHGQKGRYRKALLDYLQTLYTGKDRPNTLENLTKTSFSQLDTQYQDFIKKHVRLTTGE